MDCATRERVVENALARLLFLALDQIHNHHWRAVLVKQLPDISNQLMFDMTSAPGRSGWRPVWQMGLSGRCGWVVWL